MARFSPCLAKFFFTGTFTFYFTVKIAGDPNGDSSVDGDPFKTLFVGRIVSEMTI